MKTFENWKDAKTFIKLSILGTYGRGLTLSDIETDLKQLTIKQVKLYEDIYIVIRETGTQGLYFTKDAAAAEAKKWHNCRSILHINYRIDDRIILKRYVIL